MSDKNTSYEVKVQAVLDKVKSLSNLKTALKALESKLKVKIQGTLNSVATRKESLQAPKELHDYQRTIAEKTDSIVTVQKQIAAYEGDSSQEGLARLQKLQKELADRQEELMTKKLEDFMQLVQSGLGLADEHLKEACDYMSKIADESGYTVETKALFDNVAKGITGSLKEQITKIIAAMEEQNQTEESPGANGGDKPTAYPTIDRSKFEGERDLGMDVTLPVERTADLWQNAQVRFPDMQTVLEHVRPTVAIPTLPDSFHIVPQHVGDTRTVGDCTFQFDLPNVTDSQSLIEAIRDDGKVQRAIRDVSVGQLTSNRRLEVKGIR